MRVRVHTPSLETKEKSSPLFLFQSSSYKVDKEEKRFFPSGGCPWFVSDSFFGLSPAISVVIPLWGGVKQVLVLAPHLLGPRKLYHLKVSHLDNGTVSNECLAVLRPLPAPIFWMYVSWEEQPSGCWCTYLTCSALGRLYLLEASHLDTGTVSKECPAILRPLPAPILWMYMSWEGQSGCWYTYLTCSALGFQPPQGISP